jgi:light-regulated signal transduction histidine kinase (bacteriophytochrome)/CheY-like chemotaxis protein
MDNEVRTENLLPDLSICDREPITRLERIQPFGFLLAMSSDWLVVRASENLKQHLGLNAAAVIGTKLDALIDSKSLHDIRNRMLALYLTRGTERIFGIALKPDRPLFDVSVHQSGALFILEGEPSGEGNQIDAASVVRGAMARLAARPTLEGYFTEAVRQIRSITGFDRVMIYRFDDTGAGEVVAESLASKVDSYLGLHFPASDIPVQARALYLRNPFRIIADVDAPNVALISTLLDSEPLDLTLSVTRSVSPVHIEYLRNMGVGASMSISIIVHGKLWGLFACHHAGARLPSFVIRTAAELLGQVFSLSLESRLRDQYNQEEERLRQATSQLLDAIVGDDALLARSEWLQDVLHEIIDGDGIAIVIRDHVSTVGDTPGEGKIRDLAARLRLIGQNRVFATDDLTTIAPDAAQYLHRAAGMLAIPISSTPRDYILLFRQEALRQIKWAGDPAKPVSGEKSARISPRKSFDVFAQTIKGKSRPFSQREKLAAEEIRSALIEVILRVSESADVARQRLSERQEVLIAELNHRVRNVLALIRSVIKQSRTDATDIDGYIDSVTGRIHSLARAHDRMTRQDRSPAVVSSLLDDEIEAYVPTQRERIRVQGATVILHAKAFSTLALVIHELVTNSCKHGALSSTGSVDVILNHVPGDGLHLAWREHGGPAVTAPKRRGFGSVIIERTIPFDLQGRATLEYAALGLQAEFFIPECHIAPAGPVDPTAAPRRVPQKVTETRPLEGLTVLLLEDNLIVALEAEELLKSLGAIGVDTASSVRGATDYLNVRSPQFAMLDVNLGVDTSFSIAARLREEGVPHIFASGYGEDWMDSHSGGGVYCVAKPYDRDHLEVVITECLREFTGTAARDLPSANV